VRLTVVRSQPGVYQVKAENLTGSFAVVAPGGTLPTTQPPAQNPTTPPANPDTTPPSGESSGGLHLVYVVLLVIAGLAFLTLIVLVLAGAL
jgi:hypothetical protein